MVKPNLIFPTLIISKGQFLIGMVGIPTSYAYLYEIRGYNG